MGGNGIIDVFPISASAFGMPTGWFETFAVKLIRPSYLLMILFLVISVGVMVLRRYENSNLEKKLWNIPIILVAASVWPSLVYGVKDLIDSFNTFLIRNVFHVEWVSFGFPSMESPSNILGWSADSVARLLPNLSYWIIYTFYFVFFFFFAVLGPFVMAKGILLDEIDVFLELIIELALLFLWQTTLVILVCIVLPEIVSGDSIASYSGSNVFFRSFILGIVILFVPPITKKFATHLGHSMITPALTRSLSFVAFGAAWGIGTKSVAMATGAKTVGEGVQRMTHRISTAEDIAHRYVSQRKVSDLTNENEQLKSEEEEYREHQYNIAENESQRLRSHLSDVKKYNDAQERIFEKPKHELKNKNPIVDLSQKAKTERDED